MWMLLAAQRGEKRNANMVHYLFRKCAKIVARRTNELNRTAIRFHRYAS